MTTYATVSGTAGYNRAKYKPHDKNRVRMAKIQHNFAATEMPAGDVINCLTIPANSVVIGAWAVFTTKSSLGDAEISLGWKTAGTEYDAKGETEGTVPFATSPISDQNVEFKKTANILQMNASNTLDVNAGVVDVVAAWIELDSLGAAG